jgi:hypothetical protein
MIKPTLDRKKELLAGVFLFAMTISHVIMLPQLVPLLRNGYQNFTIFYTAGKMVRDGRTAVLYNLSAQYEVQRQFAPDVRIRQAALPYNHPPFEALLFVPLTLLPYWKAYLLWTAFNLIMLALTLFILRRQFAEISDLSPVFVVLAATGFFPVVTALVQGQDCILLLFFFALAMVAFEKGSDVAAGAFLAAGLFRFQLALPLILILAFRRWRLLLGFAPVAALLGVASLMMVGWKGATDYVRFVLSLEKSGAGGSIVAAGMPNLRGIITGVPGLSASPTLVAALTAVCSLAAILIAVWWIHVAKASGSFAFTLATLTAILVSYHALAYDLSLLLPALLLLFSVPGRGTRVETQGDILLLLFLFLIPRFGLLGSWLGSLGWAGAFLGWLFWKCNSAAQNRELHRIARNQTLLDGSI